MSSASEILHYLKYLNVLEFVGEPVQERFAVLGFGPIQARFLMGLFLSVPLGILYRFCVYKIPRAARIWLTLLFGFQIMWFIYGMQTLNLIACAVVTFAIMKLLPLSISYIVAFIFCIAYMEASHLYIMFTAYMSWEPDFTAPFMVLSIKLTSYAFSVHDAYYHHQLLESKDKSQQEGDPKNPAPADLTPRQLHYMVEEQPGFLDYMAWVFFFPGFFGGPAVEYMDFSRFMDGSMFKDMKGKIPSCLKDGTLVFLECSVFMAAIAIFGNYDMSNARAKLADPVVAAEIPFWRRYLIMTVAAMLQRAKYYSVWLMGELASRATGVGFSGMVKDPKTGELVANWDNSVNVKPFGFEFANSMKVAVDVWNMATERWLRYYCFERLAFTPLAKWNRGLTFVFSAFWHGVYPAYYMTFVTAALVREVGAYARRKLRPYVVQAAKKRPFIHTIYDILSTICVIICLNPLFCCFGMLSAHDAIEVFKSTYFCGYWILALGVIVLPFVPTLKTDNKPKSQ